MTMATQESDGEQIAENVEELRSRVHELEQKLAMSEQAVNDKDKELQAIREALDNAKSEAATDLTLPKEEAEREMCELERELREASEATESRIARGPGSVQFRPQKSGGKI